MVAGPEGLWPRRGSLKVFFQTIVPEEDAVPGAAIAIQTFGDLLGFNPHCHILCPDGGFYGKGIFRVAPWVIPQDLEKLFRYRVFPTNRGTSFQGKDHRKVGSHVDGLASGS
jgi:hypothetical protein